MIGGLIGAGATWLAVTRWDPARVALLGTPTPTPAPPPPTPTPTPTAPPLPTATPPPTPTPFPTATPSRGLADLVADASPSVVTVINARGQRAAQPGVTLKDVIWGSGVIVDARGYILTNQHVALDTKEVVVSLSDGRDLFARFVAADAKLDLALLKITTSGTFRALNWGDSGRLRQGDSITVIGSPLGNLPNSVTTGIISGLERSVTVDDNTKMSGLIQTDAAINQGNSGGALLNSRGELIGVVTLIIREAVTSKNGDVQGVSFAIPAAVARPLVEKWIAADK